MSLERARELIDAGELDEAWKIVEAYLTDDPNDVRALVMGCFILRKAGHHPEAYHLSRTATQFAPGDAACWINFGHAAADLWRADEAERAYRKALDCGNIGELDFKRSAKLNLCALYIDHGRYVEALGIAQDLYRKYPDNNQVEANLGFCLLALRDWSGWKHYRAALGQERRPRTQYADEPEWDGTPDQTVVLYGEQGLGDEISFASMIPDAVKVSKKVILECDPRLKGLFSRSFPQVKVYGTRGLKSGKWDKEDWAFDASLAMGQIGEYFRLKDEDFPRTPYLTACPVRLKAWRGYFEAREKPVIGIAWRGGVAHTNARNRQLSLEQLLPVFRSVEAVWVCLDYKDARKEIEAFTYDHPDIELVQYRWATLTQDYDDTAALVAALDGVICMQTAVAHTAGALGVPTLVLVPRGSQWRYGNSEDRIPWYDRFSVIRQKSVGWEREIQRAAAQIRTHFPRVSVFTRDPARTGRLRDGLSGVRTAGVADH